MPPSRDFMICLPTPLSVVSATGLYLMVQQGTPRGPLQEPSYYGNPECCLCACCAVQPAPQRLNVVWVPRLLVRWVLSMTARHLQRIGTSGRPRSSPTTAGSPASMSPSP